MKRISRIVGEILLWIMAAGMIAWACCAIYYSDISWPWLRALLAILFGLLALGWLVLTERIVPRIGVFLVAFLAVVVWWTTIPASNSRDWMTDVALLPSAIVDGDQVTIHNIRNFIYKDRNRLYRTLLQQDF